MGEEAIAGRIASQWPCYRSGKGARPGGGGSQGCDALRRDGCPTTRAEAHGPKMKMQGIIRQARSGSTASTSMARTKGACGWSHYDFNDEVYSNDGR